ncbi:MAG: M23 family metallopeptidase [Bacteroidaceae bacterium]|nr:M23 family metallopeptidase [Candidatus Colenecus caballi]MCQ2072014.1 M23 family metallopeptidase [Bacteroidaceae bacterium]
MKKVYYQYDPQARVYRRVFPTFGQRLKAWFIRLLSAALLGGVFFIIYLFAVSTPKVGDLVTENSRLQSQYRVLSRKVDDALLVLHDIEERDNNLYRVLLEADPVPESARQSGFNGTSRYAELLDMTNAELVVNTSQKVDMLEKKLYMQTRSFNEVLELSREQENKLACIPAIQPVSNKDLKRTASGYGWRSDPIYRVRRFHHGMDFACDTGTPVYATGNGVVTYAKWQSGYGNFIIIDHGYGYVTRYAHLSKIEVKQGQKVVRGEEIGLVGSTGKSTGPHLHYEVIVGKTDVNPVNYYFMDLNAQQYEEMISLAENHGKVFD